MKPEFNNGNPIYQQIIDLIKVSISKGNYSPGAKVPPVRELAVDFGVNPNTVQRALAKLEEMGYLYTERTSGRYVTKDLTLITELRTELLREIIDEFLMKMEASGIEKSEVINHLKAYMERMEKR